MPADGGESIKPLDKGMRPALLGGFTPGREVLQNRQLSEMVVRVWSRWVQYPACARALQSCVITDDCGIISWGGWGVHGWVNRGHQTCKPHRMCSRRVSTVDTTLQTSSHVQPSCVNRGHHPANLTACIAVV
eukprot:1057461-Pelagomonas_calceolata.AAC.1